MTTPTAHPLMTILMLKGVWVETGASRCKGNREGDRYAGNLYGHVKSLAILFLMPSFFFLDYRLPYIVPCWLKNQSEGCILRFNFDGYGNPVSMFAKTHTKYIGGFELSTDHKLGLTILAQGSLFLRECN